MNDRERDTILAGLRALQDRMDVGEPYTQTERSQLATNGGEHEAMTSDEINELCERLNVPAECEGCHWVIDEPIVAGKCPNCGRDLA